MSTAAFRSRMWTAGATPRPAKNISVGPVNLYEENTQKNEPRNCHHELLGDYVVAGAIFRLYEAPKRDLPQNATRGRTLNADILAAVTSLTQDMKWLKEKVEQLVTTQTVQDHYSTEEFARLTGLEARTVRDYLNENRLNGEKKRSGHGRSKTWAVPHQELLRFRKEGLLPLGNRR